MTHGPFFAKGAVFTLHPAIAPISSEDKEVFEKTAIVCQTVERPMKSAVCIKVNDDLQKVDLPFNILKFLWFSGTRPPTRLLRASS